jgi:hypothetical protein
MCGLCNHLRASHDKPFPRYLHSDFGARDGIEFRPRGCGGGVGWLRTRQTPSRLPDCELNSLSVRSCEAVASNRELGETAHSTIPAATRNVLVRPCAIHSNLYQTDVVLGTSLPCASVCAYGVGSCASKIRPRCLHRNRVVSDHELCNNRGGVHCPALTNRRRIARVLPRDGETPNHHLLR